MPLIVYSRENQAGETIAAQLLQRHPFSPQEPLTSPDNKYSWRNWKTPTGLQLVELTTMHIFSDYLKDYPLFNQTDLLIVASTHKSGAGVPALTAHVCGNWGAENKLGGNPRELAYASAYALKSGFHALEKHGADVEGFEIAIEATHHGPTSLHAPILFMELGSTEKEWGLSEPAGAVAEAIMQTAADWNGVRGKVALGFGGMHYLTKFADLEREGYAFSHVASKHLVPAVDAQMVKQAVAKTVEPVTHAFVEKKSLKSLERITVENALQEAGLEYELI